MATAAPLRIENPATGQLLEEVPCYGAAEVEAAVARGRIAQKAWGALPFSVRADALRRLLRAMRDDPGFLPTLVSESGKPRYEAELIELFYALELTRFYTSRVGRRALRDEIRHPLVFFNKRARVIRHPRGVVGVIGPWNWPLLNNFADCIPALLAGNAAVLKPSEWTPLTSLRVARLWRELGLPENVFQVVTGRGEAGQAITQNCDMVFFTGSSKVGTMVARAAGERLIPAVVELGGKSVMIVLADANLELAAHAAVWSGFAHSGQVCIRTERVLVEEHVADRFVSLCAEEIRGLRQAAPVPGDADTVNIDVGAMTFQPQVEVAEHLIADARARGAKVMTGGAKRTDIPGRFFAPTLIADCTNEMAVMREETFGPVLPVLRVRDAEEALRIANDSPMGLSGSVWSGDEPRARALARRLESGTVCVNDVLVNYMCVEAPLGGIKASGMGFRHGPEGLRQFCRVETVIENRRGLGWIAPIVAKNLWFPYKPRTLKLLRKFMKVFY
ncbi:MAG: aldehyde dehydrogenase family protein [Gemmatimonadota bacterium]